MATWKCTNLINYSTASGRAGGASETLYYQGESKENVMTRLKLLVQARMLCTGERAISVARRVVDIGKPNETLLNTDPIPGRQSVACDTPGQTLLLSLTTIGNNQAPYYLKFIPDGNIDKGDWTAAPHDTGTNVVAFMGLLINGGWRIRGKVIPANTPRVKTISTGGVVEMLDAIVGLTAQSTVEFYRTRNVDGRPVKGQYYIKTFVDTSNFTLADYAEGQVKRGKLRLHALDTFDIDNAVIKHIMHKKIGRPFFPFRGRSSGH